MLNLNYPCFCLKRGFFLLITYRRPFLLTILQSALRFLIEALTFIFLSFIYLIITAGVSRQFEFIIYT